MKMYSYWETSLSYLEQQANNNIYLDNIDWTDYVQMYQMYGKKYHAILVYITEVEDFYIYDRK